MISSPREFADSLIEHWKKLWDRDWVTCKIEQRDADITRLARAQGIREALEPLIEEFENLTILGSYEKIAGYECAMRTAVTHLKATLEKETSEYGHKQHKS